MKKKDGGESPCGTLVDGGRKFEPKTEPHPPHPWEWQPDHGPQVVTVYHCPGA